MQMGGPGPSPVLGRTGRGYHPEGRAQPRGTPRASGPKPERRRNRPCWVHQPEEKKGGLPAAGRGGRGQGAPQQGPKGGEEEVQVLTEELNRRGLAYVWGLMGLPGGLACIMIDSGNLVGDVVSEEFAQQANLAGESGRRTLSEGDRDCRRREQDADHRKVLPHQAADRGDRDFFRNPTLDCPGDEERSQPGTAVPEPAQRASHVHGGQGVPADRGKRSIPRGERVQRARRASRQHSSCRGILRPSSAGRQGGSGPRPGRSAGEHQACPVLPSGAGAAGCS